MPNDPMDPLEFRNVELTPEKKPTSEMPTWAVLVVLGMVCATVVACVWLITR